MAADPMIVVCCADIKNVEKEKQAKKTSVGEGL